MSLEEGALLQSPACWALDHLQGPQLLMLMTNSAAQVVRNPPHEPVVRDDLNPGEKPWELKAEPPPETLALVT